MIASPLAAWHTSSAKPQAANIGDPPMRHTALAFVVLFSCAIPASAAEKKMAKIEKRAFGKTPDGTAVDLYILTNANGIIAKIMTYGATLTELHVPDRAGKLADVVLGFDKLDGY